MINLKVEEYCHGCRDFESDTHYDYAGEINNISIFCKHRSKCAQLKKYIEKTTCKSPIKSVELCKTCGYYVRGTKCNGKECKGCPLYSESSDSIFTCYCANLEDGSLCMHYAPDKETENDI